tara:strand:- start:1041 stop:1397 length:357 start_codon:yes stop_codon:yes gene_type:complete
MKGKITHIIPRGEYSNASGVFNKYQVRFDDGREFQFLAKGDFKKSVGEMVEYKVTNEEYKTAKLEYNPQPTVNNNSKEQLIIRQSMVKASCEFHSSRPQSDIHTVLADSQLLIDFINK